jgi:hypothetical protein
MRILDWLRSRVAPAAPAAPSALPPSAGAPPTPLSDLMTRVLDERSDEARRAFYQAFLRSPVGVIASGGEPGPEPGSMRNVGFARAATPDGRVMLLACADRNAFAQNFHARFNEQILGRELARAVLGIPDCEGILVNSAASFHSIAIPRDELATLLDPPP